MDIIKEFTIGFMRDISVAKGYTIVKQDSEIHLDRFFIDFTLDDPTYLSFTLYYNLCQDIYDIIDLPYIYQSTTIPFGNMSRVFFNVDISEDVYPKSDDRINRNIERRSSKMVETNNTFAYATIVGVGGIGNNYAITDFKRRGA